MPVKRLDEVKAAREINVCHLLAQGTGHKARD
jgi:hypothetical protein